MLKDVSERNIYRPFWLILVDPVQDPMQVTTFYPAVPWL